MFLEEFKKEKYNTTFDNVYSNLNYQRNNDPKYTIEKLEALLESLYTSQGNDWIGKGEIKEVTNNATIAACEQVLAEWKEDLGDYESPNN
ncbi:hypothetical protein [Dethiothermospora halolimnae]|uniref:hypothetical protein n=1 Tax=Dethiothermospora halolimnae TaxID=3114390 RepID=UPI003CCBBBD4